MQFMVHSAKAILKTVDPRLQGVFIEWRRELCKKTAIYIKQTRLWNKYQEAVANKLYIKPFADEAQRVWNWPEFYQAEAQPAAAFAELRRKHAQEAQEFILSHQKVCLETLSQQLKVSHQCEILMEQVTRWLALNKDAKAELLEKQARSYAELVCREEMSEAERKIKESDLSPRMVVLLRLLCFIVTIITPASLDLERLVNVAMTLFALGCGLALFAEEPCTRIAHLLFGDLLKYLSFCRHLGSQNAFCVKPSEPANPVEEVN